jgi:hypothetical protein
LKTLTDLALNKMANAYLNSLSHVLYNLDGEEKRLEFFSKKVVGRTVQAYVLFDENYKGKITNIRVIDKDGDVVAVDNKLYERTSEKALYIAFKHEFTEV